MSAPIRALLAVAAIAAALALSPPATATSPPATAGAGAKPGALKLNWKACGKAGAQCATATVPKDYDSPRRGTLKLAVAKSPAKNPKQRIGSLFFNLGGPGAFAAPYVAAFGPDLFPVLNERFDIIGVDPRGADIQTGIDCRVNQEAEGLYAKPFLTPENVSIPRLVRDSARYVRACLERNDDLEYYSTANVARDFNAVREALGEEKMTYLGFSYGTFLGATIQSLFPGKTRAVVLDGAVDPDQYINEPLDSLEEQSAGFERATSRFLEACRANSGAELCPFGQGDPRAKLDELIERADGEPIPASRYPERPVTGDDIRGAIVQSMYTIDAWSDLADALQQLEAGDGSGIRVLADGFFGRDEDGGYSSGSDKYFVLTSLERRFPRRLSRYLETGRRSHRSYDYSYWNAGYRDLARGMLPIRARDRFSGPFRTSERDPTTLVVGTRYDSATPYAESKRLARQLGNARLLTMVGDGHTAYDGLGGVGNNACTDTAIERYLFNLELPPEGTRCKQGKQPFVREPAGAQAALADRPRVVIRPGTRPMPRLP